MSLRRLDNACGGGASVTIAPYEYPLVWDFVGKGRYLQAAFCKSVAQLYSTKFGCLTSKNLSNFSAEGVLLGLLNWSKEVGCRWDESVFVSGASSGSVEVLGHLLENGCPFTKDAAACTAAAKGGHLEALKFLSLCGCHGDANTFLVGAENGHLSVIQFAHLFRCEWDPKHVCTSVARKGHMHILQWMHETLHVDGLFDEETCEAAASSKCGIEVLQWLRSVGCPWDANTCWSAIRKGHLAALRWAIGEGCPWAVDDKGADEFRRTSSHLAATYGYMDMLEFFLSCGANLNAVDRDGWTIIYTAAVFSQIEIIQRLLREEVDVNTPDFEGVTPLAAALREGCEEEVLEILRAAGARE